LHLCDLQDAGFVQRRIAQIVVARRLMAFQPDPTAAPPPPLSAPPAALPEDTEPPPKPALPPPPPTPTPTPKADEVTLTPDEEFNRRANATGYDVVTANASRGMPRSTPQNAMVSAAGAKMNPSGGSGSGKASAEAAAAVAARAGPVAGKGDDVVEEMEEVDEDEEEEGCLLEENPVVEVPVTVLSGAPNPKAKKTMEVDDDDDDDDDDDGCMLEDNPTDCAPAKKSAEVNDEDEGEDECMLEENQVART
jgi:hypothetical protein